MPICVYSLSRGVTTSVEGMHSLSKKCLIEVLVGVRVISVVRGGRCVERVGNALYRRVGMCKLV